MVSWLFGRLLWFFLVLAVIAAVVVGATSPSDSDGATFAPVPVCKDFKKSSGLSGKITEVRIRADYYESAFVRWTYYSHPGDTTLLLLDQAYSGQALELVKGHLKRSPKLGKPDASAPVINIRSIRISRSGDCAELLTEESWRLTRGGKVVFQEKKKIHRIFMVKEVLPLRPDRWTVWQIS